MSASYEIFTYGGGDALREVFNAIAALMGSDTYHSLIKLSIMLAASWVTFTAIFQRDLMMNFRWLGTYFVVFYILFLPKVTVNITDRIEQANHRAASTVPVSSTVDNVPLGLALFASLTSQIGDALTQTLDQNFSLPNDLRYSQSGTVMASKLVTASSRFHITDGDFALNMQRYVERCVFYDLLLGKYTIEDFYKTDDLWGFIQSYASPSRAFVYFDRNNAKRNQIKTCQAGAALLNARWSKAIDKSATHYGARLFPDLIKGLHLKPVKERAAKNILLSYLPMSYQYLTGLSADASKLMQQNMMMNAIENGMMIHGASTNAPAALQAYAFNKAQAQKRMTYNTLGQMASHWLPLMKNVFEAMLYGSFIFILALAFFPFGWGVVRQYVFSLFWLQTWAPLYAILNLLVTIYAKGQSGAAVSLAGYNDGLTLLTQSDLVQMNADMASLAGYLSLSIPFISMGLVRGMASTFTQLAQYVGGATQAAAGGAAAEAVTGNFSLGNTSFETRQMQNTHFFDRNTSGRVNSGSFTHSMPGGSSSTHTPAGTDVLNTGGAISQLGTSVNLSESLRAQAMEQSNEAWNASVSQSQASMTALTDGVRQVVEFGDSQAQHQQASDSSSISQSTGFSQSAQQVSRLVHQFAKEHDISDVKAEQVLVSNYSEAKGTGSLSIEKGTVLPKLFGVDAKARFEASGSIGHKNDSTVITSQTESTIYKDAEQFSKEHQFGETLDKAYRESQEQSFRDSSEGNQRFSDNLSHSFDAAKTYREEASSQASVANSYSEYASYAQEHAASINSNANQQFKDWLTEQPGMNERSVEAMMTNSPGQAQQYADQFLKQQSEQGLKDWAKSHDLGSPDKIYGTFEENNKVIDAKKAKNDIIES